MTSQHERAFDDKEKLTLDLAIIGAGIYGIQAARTYLEIHPSHNVAVFEADGHIGGVWSSERVFDLFTTQTPLNIAEFSDLPLRRIPEAECYHGFFPAKYITSYLESYVMSHTYEGSSLRSRIFTNAYVEKLTKIVKGWKLDVVSTGSNNQQQRQYLAIKVIDATGLTSTPKMPLLPGEEKFHGIILHHRQFAKHYNEIQHDNSIDNVIVIGGGKSGADVAYSCAKVGKKVNWIIRKSGAGPAAFVSVSGLGPYRNSNESFYTRFTSLFLTSLYIDEFQSLLGRALYRTKLGRLFLKAFWNIVDAKAHRNANYSRRDGQANHFYELKPDTSIFWQQDSTGIAQHPDFFDVIAHKVRVFRQDIEEVNGDGVTLVDGRQVEGDIIVCATGWKNCHPDIVDDNDRHIELELGLAGFRSSQLEKSSRKREEVERTELDNIVKRFPHLKHPPTRTGFVRDKSPLRLYKGIIPVHHHDHSIAFMGQMLLGNNFRVAETQALFAVAALDGKLTLPSLNEMKVDVVRHLAWSKLRYLNKGKSGTWLYWDTVPYTDHLLETLGLRSHRHKSFLKDLFATCFAADLRGLIAEYKEKFEIKE